MKKIYNVETKEDLKQTAKAMAKAAGERHIELAGNGEAIERGIARVASKAKTTITINTDEDRIEFECGAGFCIDKNTGKKVLTFDENCPPEKREKLILSMLKGEYDLRI